MHSPSNQPGADRQPGKTGWQSPITLGVVGAVLLFLGIAVLTALSTPPFRSADETAHTAYAIAVGYGHIPHADDPVEPLIPGQHKQATVYTSNHPPLYYALESLPLVQGVGHGHPLGGFYLARIESAVFSAVTVGLTVVLAGMLVGRHRPEIAVTAAALMATIGAFVYTSSFIYNDSLATMLSVALLVGVLALLRDGLRISGCILVVLTAAAAICTRVSNAEIVFVGALGVIAAGVIHTRTRWIGLAKGLCVAAIGGATCIASVGWFFLMNQHRYGHLTGREDSRESIVWTLQHRAYPDHLAMFVVSPYTYGNLARQAYGDLLGINKVLTWSGTALTVGVVAVWSLVGAGLVWLLVNSRFHIRRPRTGLAPALLCAAHFLLSLAYVIWWVHIGNYPHLRYMFPVLPIVATVMAACVGNLPGGKFWASITVTGQLILALIYLAIMPAQWTGSKFWHVYPDALKQAAIPAATLITVLLVLAIVTGWGLCLYAIFTAKWGQRPAAPRHRLPRSAETISRPVTSSGMQ